MNYILTGFKQDTGVRVFSFEGIAADRTRAAFSVKADLGLARQHGIRMQELPLLCRQLLEECEAGQQTSAMTFTEASMRLHAAKCALLKDATRNKPYQKARAKATADSVQSLAPRF